MIIDVLIRIVQAINHINKPIDSISKIQTLIDCR
jgi:hypothetical protein